MRRGLISWSREEMPVAVLDQRLARLQAAMRAENLGAVLAYTSFAQPAAVHWITNFTPYWSEALLVMLPEGAPVLLASLTKRVHTWIREVSHIGEVVMAPRLGPGAVRLLAEKIGADARIGVIGLDSLPWPVGEPLSAAYPDRVVDAGPMFAALRQPADAEERALAVHAAAIGRAALDAAPAHARQASELTAAIEAAARLAGAEEVLQRIVPDLAGPAALLRMEGDAALGARHAVEVSLAYKGAWVRVTRSIADGPAPASWAAAQAWFDATVAGMGEVRDGQLPIAAPGQLVQWSLEASVGLHPLTVVMAQGRPATVALPAGSLAVFSAQLALEDGHWLCAAPLVMGA
ncbi:MAG: aminopeptidase P family N-terminal domain-containing protein [Pseudomonadota bacterium]